MGAFLSHLEPARQRKRHPQRPPGSDPLAVQVRGPKAPEHAAVISQVLAIPPRRRERAIVSYLAAEEIDALVAAPGRETWHGRRDRALLLLDVQPPAGLRAHRPQAPGHPPRGRAARPLPRQGPQGPGHPPHRPGRQGHADLARRAQPRPRRPAVPDQPGGRLSRNAVERLVTRHAATAAGTCPSIGDKHVSPHALRHSAAMTLLKRRRHVGHRSLARTLFRSPELSQVASF